MRDALVHAALALALLAGPAAAARLPWYQLVLRHEAAGWKVLSFQRIPDALKRIETPDPGGHTVRLDYELAWRGESGRVLHRTRVRLPVSIRPAGVTKRAQDTRIPSSGLLVARAEGPADAASVRAVELVRRDAVKPALELPASLARERVTLPLTGARLRRAKGDSELPAFAVTKILDTGDDANRVVIVVLGDGYTRADLATGAYAAQSKQLVESLLARSPWDRYKGAVNVYRIDVESAESGATEPDLVPPVHRDTYLQASFAMFGIGRLLALSDTGTYRAVALADALVGPGLWDQIQVLVNSPRYGGSGGLVAVASIAPSVDHLVAHELGHSFASLADEYTSPGPPGVPDADLWPNVDVHPVHGPDLKWWRWVDPSTPLPTPPAGGPRVGAFEGAYYQQTGVYRPEQECAMRSLGFSFCAVCREALALGVLGRVSLSDRVTPAAGTVQPIGAGMTFAVETIAVQPLEFVWQLGQLTLPAHGATLTLKPADVPPGQTRLELRIRHPSDLIRRGLVQQVLRWTVSRD